MEKDELIFPGVIVRTAQGHRVSADGLMLARFLSARRCGRAVDLCAGGGLIGAALFGGDFPPDELVAVDISPSACALALKTAESPAIEGKMRVINADALALNDRIPAGWADLVVINPPYFGENDGKTPADPHRRLARAGGKALLTGLCESAGRLLRSGGRLALCHRPEAILQVADAMRLAGIEPKIAALAAHSPGHRPFLLMMEGTKAARPGLVWQPSVFVEGK